MYYIYTYLFVWYIIYRFVSMSTKFLLDKLIKYEVILTIHKSLVFIDNFIIFQSKQYIITIIYNIIFYK